MTNIMRNKAPPKKMGRARAKCPNSPVAVTPATPRQQTGVTKSKPTTKLPEKHKPRQPKKVQQRFRTYFWRLCFLFYKQWISVSKATLWITMKYHDEAVHIILLLVIIYLEYYVHAAALLHH